MGSVVVISAVEMVTRLAYRDSARGMLSASEQGCWLRICSTND